MHFQTITKLLNLPNIIVVGIGHQESYLLFQLQMFSNSLKSTMRASFKPYAIDTGFRNRVAFAFSEDLGWRVENVVFCHLKRQHEEVYSFFPCCRCF